MCIHEVGFFSEEQSNIKYLNHVFLLKSAGTLVWVFFGIIIPSDRSWCQAPMKWFRRPLSYWKIFILKAFRFFKTSELSKNIRMVQAVIRMYTAKFPYEPYWRTEMLPLELYPLVQTSIQFFLLCGKGMATMLLEAIG